MDIQNALMGMMNGNQGVTEEQLMNMASQVLDSDGMPDMAKIMKVTQKVAGPMLKEMIHQGVSQMRQTPELKEQVAMADEFLDVVGDLIGEMTQQSTGVDGEIDPGLLFTNMLNGSFAEFEKILNKHGKAGDAARLKAGFDAMQSLMEENSEMLKNLERSFTDSMMVQDMPSGHLMRLRHRGNPQTFNKLDAFDQAFEAAVKDNPLQKIGQGGPFDSLKVDLEELRNRPTMWYERTFAMADKTVGLVCRILYIVASILVPLLVIVDLVQYWVNREIQYYYNGSYMPV